jgi:hypothetical protein
MVDRGICQKTCLQEDRRLECKGERSDGRRGSKDESDSGEGGTDVRNLISVFRVPWNLKFDIFRAVLGRPENLPSRVCSVFGLSEVDGGVGQRTGDLQQVQGTAKSNDTSLTI